MGNGMGMKRSMWKLGLLLLLSGVLAGCEGDSASYMIGGNRDHALTLFRDKPWPWSDWELNIVVSRLPECMRRHPLKAAPGDGAFKLEIYRSLEGGFILRQGKRWYVAETEKCQLQQFKEPPAEPGELIGSFSDKSGLLKFTTDKNGKTPQ